jgi:hypothetical protein
MPFDSGMTLPMSSSRTILFVLCLASTALAVWSLAPDHQVGSFRQVARFINSLESTRSDLNSAIAAIAWSFSHSPLHQARSLWSQFDITSAIF